MNANETKEVEILKSALDSGKETIKACVLINGGAAIALLAFLGHVVTKPDPGYELLPRALLPSLSWFVAGIVFAVLGHVASYGSNLYFCFGPMRTGNRFRMAALSFTFAAVIFFALGCYSAYRGFVSFKPDRPKRGAAIQEVK